MGLSKFLKIQILKAPQTSFSKINMGNETSQSLELSRTSITLRVTDHDGLVTFNQTCAVIPDSLPVKPSNWRPTEPRSISRKLVNIRKPPTLRNAREAAAARPVGELSALAKHLCSLVQ